MPTIWILKTLKARWSRLRQAPAGCQEPLDHPCLQAMSLRELADLPLEPPPMPGRGIAAVAVDQARAALPLGGADRRMPGWNAC